MIKVHSEDCAGRRLTALHMACLNNRAAIVAVLGADRRVTREVLNMKDGYGDTALMTAVKHGYVDCVKEMAKLVGVNWDTKNVMGENLKTVAKKKNQEAVLRYLDRKVVEEVASLEKTEDEEIKEIVKHINAAKECYKIEHDILEENQSVAIKVFDDKQTKERRKFIETLHDAIVKHNEEYDTRIKDLEGILHAFTSPQSAALTSPDCPVCLDPMAPPVRIFNCPNGHLVCAACKEKMKVAICPLCLKPVMGRATAMEQLLRTLYNLK